MQFLPALLMYGILAASIWYFKPWRMRHGKTGMAIGAIVLLALAYAAGG